MDRDLMQVYWDAHGFEGIDLEAFLQDVQAGKFGTFTSAQIRHFLMTMEAQIIENIETKAAEAPQFQMVKDEMIDETAERFRLLRQQFAS